MVEGPISLHILWEEKGLLQGLSYITDVPPTIMPEGSIPGMGTPSTSDLGDQMRVGQRT